MSFIADIMVFFVKIIYSLCGSQNERTTTTADYNLMIMHGIVPTKHEHYLMKLQRYFLEGVECTYSAHFFYLSCLKCILNLFHFRPFNGKYICQQNYSHFLKKSIWISVLSKQVLVYFHRESIIDLIDDKNIYTVHSEVISNKNFLNH